MKNKQHACGRTIQTWLQPHSFGLVTGTAVERIELTVVDVVHEIATVMIFPPTVGLGWAQHRVLHKQTQCLALTRATTSVDLHVHTLNQCAAALTCPLYITESSTGQKLIENGTDWRKPSALTVEGRLEKESRQRCA